MVEENEVRASLSRSERGRIAVTTRDAGVFASLEEAVDALYASASRQKRSRLRTIARVAEDMDGVLTAPDTLAENQLLRLALALDRSFRELIVTALAESSLSDPETQWALILPIPREVRPPSPSTPPATAAPAALAACAAPCTA